jgi:hypothetical protein
MCRPGRTRHVPLPEGWLGRGPCRGPGVLCTPCAECIPRQVWLLSVQVAGLERSPGLLVMRRSGVRFPKAAPLLIPRSRTLTWGFFMLKRLHRATAERLVTGLGLRRQGPGDRRGTPVQADRQDRGTGRCGTGEAAAGRGRVSGPPTIRRRSGCCYGITGPPDRTSATAGAVRIGASQWRRGRSCVSTRSSRRRSTWPSVTSGSTATPRRRPPHPAPGNGSLIRPPAQAARLLNEVRQEDEEFGLRGAGRSGLGRSSHLRPNRK